jgi:hypothetical protein
MMHQVLIETPRGALNHQTNLDSAHSIVNSLTLRHSQPRGYRGQTPVDSVYTAFLLSRLTALPHPSVRCTNLPDDFASFPNRNFYLEHVYFAWIRLLLLFRCMRLAVPTQGTFSIYIYVMVARTTPWVRKQGLMKERLHFKFLLPAGESTVINTDSGWTGPFSDSAAHRCHHLRRT